MKTADRQIFMPANAKANSLMTSTKTAAASLNLKIRTLFLISLNKDKL